MLEASIDKSFEFCFKPGGGGKKYSTWTLREGRLKNEKSDSMFVGCWKRSSQEEKIREWDETCQSDTLPKNESDYVVHRRKGVSLMEAWTSDSLTTVTEVKAGLVGLDVHRTRSVLVGVGEVLSFS